MGNRVLCRLTEDLAATSSGSSDRVIRDILNPASLKIDVGKVSMSPSGSPQEFEQAYRQQLLINQAMLKALPTGVCMIDASGTIVSLKPCRLSNVRVGASHR